jgi:homoserine O-acetyltransferase
MKIFLWLSCVFFSGFAFADSEQQFAYLGDFRLQSGEVIQDARVGYLVAGTLNAEKSNVIVLPSWHLGTAEQLNSYIGPGKQADTDLYFVVAIDALGNGVSSSPSNSKNQSGNLFPSVSIADMVNSQHELLTRHLGIKHVTAIIGMSMGAMQTLQWVGQFPEFMDKAVSIEGSPKMTSFDLIQWQSHIEAIELMRSAGIGVPETMSFVRHINLLTLWTPQYLVESVSPEDLDEYLTNYRAGSSQWDPDNYLLQTRSMISHDVLGLEAYANAEMWNQFRDRILMIGFDSDHMVNPAPAKALAEKMGVSYVEIETKCGHMGTVCEALQVEKAVSDFLE